MSLDARVIWSEGMFLQPQHFQQHDRHVHSLIAKATQSFRTHGWGFASLAIDEAQLAVGCLAISHCAGVLPDGTCFDVARDEGRPLSMKLDDELHDTRIALTLPVTRAGQIESDPAPTSQARYTVLEQRVWNAHAGGGSEAAIIQVGHLNLRLCKEQDVTSESTSLAVAHLLGKSADGSLRLKPDFAPPLLACGASRPLTAQLAALLARIKHRIALTIKEIDSPGHAEVKTVLLLQSLCRARAWLDHAITSSSPHPEKLYLYLTQLLAELAVLVRQESQLEAIPPYRHARPDTTFWRLFELMAGMLDRMNHNDAIRIPLIEQAFGIHHAPLAGQDTLGTARLVLLARADMPYQQLCERLPRCVKIGPAEQIKHLISLQLPGTGMRLLSTVPRQIPYYEHFSYFELQMTGSPWPRSESSSGLALHVAGEFPNLQLELWAIDGGDT